MTAAAHADDHHDRARESIVATGHRIMRRFISLYLVGFVIYLVSLALPEVEPLSWVSGGFQGLLLGLFVVYGLPHLKNLCPDCVDEMPLNPSAETTRYRRVLRRFHRAASALTFGGRLSRFNRWGRDGQLIAQVALWCGFSYGLSYLFDLAGTWGSVAFAVLTTFFVVFILSAARRHGQLQPWCPWCRGGPGDDKPVAVPDPQPSGVLSA